MDRTQATGLPSLIFLFFAEFTWPIMRPQPRESLMTLIDKSILDKTTDELTVKDSLKIQLIIVGTFVLAPVAVGTAVVAVQRVTEKIQKARRDRKILKEQLKK